MANDKKNSKKLPVIIGILVLIAAAIIAAVLIINCNKNEFDDAFFTTNDKKIVINSAANDPQAAQMGAIKMHQVYEVNGEELVSAKFYAEFDDEEKAKSADDSEELKMAIESGDVKSHKRKGKFIILEMPDSIIEGRTVAEIRAAAEYYKQYENGSYPVEDNTEKIEYTFVDDSVDDCVEEDDDNIPVEDYVEALPEEESAGEITIEEVVE